MQECVLRVPNAGLGVSDNACVLRVPNAGFAVSDHACVLRVPNFQLDLRKSVPNAPPPSIGWALAVWAVLEAIVARIYRTHPHTNITQSRHNADMNCNLNVWFDGAH